MRSCSWWRAESARKEGRLLVNGGRAWQEKGKIDPRRKKREKLYKSVPLMLGVLLVCLFACLLACFALLCLPLMLQALRPTPFELVAKIFVRWGKVHVKRKDLGKAIE